MSDRESEMTDNEPTPFAHALRQLAPQPPQLSRDALLFAAGQAAGRPRVPVWVWQTTTATFALATLVLGAFQVTPGAVPAVRYVEKPVVVPSPVVIPPEPERPSLPPPREASPDGSDELVQQIRARNEVLRWGVDMLPEAKDEADRRPAADVRALELGRWLNLPADVFATPRLQPPPPTKDD